MQRELTLTLEAIDEAAWLARRAMTRETGAAVYFSGVVRATEGGEAIAAIEYEAFERMARHQIELVFQRVEERWPVQSVRVAHRLGRVGAGETALWVEVIAPHRQEAFAACQFLIDEMKRMVPIWKKAMAH
jgi:molybdopterin synthase catalytic subunit